MASFKHLVVGAFLGILLACLGGCGPQTRIVAPSEESVAAAQRRAHDAVMSEAWWVPNWYRQSVHLRVVQGEPNRYSRKTYDARGNRDVEVGLYTQYVYFPTIVMALLFNLIAGVFLAGAQEGNKEQASLWLTLGNAFVVLLVLVLWVVGAIFGSGRGIPWHFSVFVGYGVSLAFPFVVLAFLAVGPRLSRLAAQGKSAFGRAASRRRQLQLVRIEQKAERKEEIDDRKITLHDRVRNVEIAAALLGQCSDEERVSLDREFILSVFELTGYENLIQADVLCKRNLSNVLVILDSLAYNNKSMQYIKLKSISE